MTRVIVSPQAEADIDGILERLSALAGIAVAERYANDLQAVYERLEMFPAIGASRSRLGRNIRIALLEPYIVFYRCVAEDAWQTRRA